MILIRSILVSTIILSNFCKISLANETLMINISIKNHMFQPNAILIPKNYKIKLVIHNQDKSIEEFDSVDLNREKIILGNSIVHIVLASLTSGKYCFVGEFHPELANGCLFIY